MGWTFGCFQDVGGVFVVVFSISRGFNLNGESEEHHGSHGWGRGYPILTKNWLEPHLFQDDEFSKIEKTIEKIRQIAS